MDIIRTKIKSISAYHLCFVILCCMVVYLFRAGDSYNLKPIWRKRIEPHHLENGRYPTKDEFLPSPIITDLESDGINEIILITYDFKLSILAIPESPKDQDDKTLPHIVIKEHVILPLNRSKDGVVRRPVVMATGYREPYNSMLQVRSQVIVIVTEDWFVLCYSHDLKLLWMRQLMDVVATNTYYIKSMGAVILSHEIHKGRHGLVIVGGSFGHKVHQVDKTDEENSNSSTTDSHTTEEETLTHFSTFALDGGNGETVWHHLPGEFGEDRPNIKDDEKEIHWKLSLKRKALHVGEVHWEEYQEELTNYLPHEWKDLRDTDFTIGRFQRQYGKQHVNEEPEEDDTVKNKKNVLSPEHLIGYAYGGQRPHSYIEHITNPNAVLIHNQNGIEVLNLRTGRPLTTMPLPDEGAIYMDYDHNGNLNQIKWGFQKGRTPCFVEVWQLQPIRERLERLSVCQTHKLFWTRTWSHEEDIEVKLSPLTIPSIAKKTGMFRYLLGHHLPTDKPSYDLITFGSMGRVSSMDFEGTFHWQVQCFASYNDVAREVRLSKDPTDLSRRFLNSFHPDRKIMSIPVFSQENVVVLVGWKDIALVDLKYGEILAQHSLPCHPTAPLVVGDFNNDGFNDIIHSCELGYIGFSIETKSNHLYTALYVASVFLMIILLAWILSPDMPNFLDDEDKND